MLSSGQTIRTLEGHDPVSVQTVDSEKELSPGVLWQAMTQFIEPARTEDVQVLKERGFDLTELFGIVLFIHVALSDP